MEEAWNATKTVREKVDWDKIWHNKESAAEEKNLTILKERMEEEEERKEDEDQLDWDDAGPEGAMLRVPHRRSNEWLKNRKPCKFEDWQGHMVGTRAMMSAWLSAPNRPKGIPYDMDYEGEQQPPMVHKFTLDTVTRVDGTVMYKSPGEESWRMWRLYHTCEWTPIHMYTRHSD